LLLGTGFMSIAAFSFIAFPRLLLRVFTDDPAVIATGVSLLFIAAIFQLFDGVQGVSTGVLRGLGDTRTPMLSNLAAHWLLGLPLAYTLAFPLGWGVEGLWIGLSAGLIVVGAVLLWVWSVRSRRLEVEPWLELPRAGTSGDRPPETRSAADSR
jgi:multidrug resistance protein, MATE family